MYNDPTNPYEDPTTPPTSTNTYPNYGDPDGNGWWELVGGVWRWMTEPLPRTATPIT